jgi:hypothetical protein
MVLWLVALAVGLIPTGWPMTTRGQDASGQKDAWAKYEIILQRNIFSRNRQAFRPQESREEPQQVAMPNPESYYVLKGIVQEDSEFIAFVEDKRDGGILRLRQGDEIARGVIKALNLDTLEYEMGDQVTTVRLGSDLEGGYGAVTSADVMEWSQTPATSTEPVQSGPQPPPSGDEAEILRRLMEQRKQQLGQ